MPLKITDPVKQVASLNRWADWIESQLKHSQTKIAATNQTGVKTATAVANATGSVELKVPSIFTPIDQTVVLPGPLSVSLTPEPASTFFAAPAITSGGASYIDQQATVENSVATNVSLTLTPSIANEWALFGYVAGGQGTHYAPSGTGWNSIYSGYFGAALYSNSPSTSAFNATATLDTPNKPAAGFLALFGTTGSAPSVLQTAQLQGGFPSGASSASFGLSLTAGSTIFAHAEVNVTTGGTLSTPTITDTYGNVWTLVSFTQTGSTTGCAIGLWICTAPSPSTSTVTINLSTNTSFTTFFIFEVNNLKALPGVPIFRVIVGGDLPTPTTTTLGGVRSEEH